MGWWVRVNWFLSDMGVFEEIEGIGGRYKSYFFMLDLVLVVFVGFLF